jgi:hypothetical protein
MVINEKKLRVLEELKSDEELKADGKNRQHMRNQRVLDSLYSVFNFAIWAIPIILLIYFVVLIIHFIMVGDWNSIKAYFDSGMVFVAGYFAHFLQTTLDIKDFNQQNSN